MSAFPVQGPPAATVDQMRTRTDWGNLLPPTNEPQPPAPGLPVPVGNLFDWQVKPNRAMFLSYERSLQLDWVGTGIVVAIAAPLVAEILVLRHQINILRRHSPKRRTFSAMDRLIFSELYRLAPTVLNALAVLKPDTVIKWHRAGCRRHRGDRFVRRADDLVSPTLWIADHGARPKTNFVVWRHS